MSPARLLVAHRLELLRRGLCHFIREAHVEWSTEQTRDFHSILGLCSSLKISLALIDYNLPGMKALDGIQRLREMVPDCSIVILADTDDRAAVLDCLEAGAQGFISTTATPLQLFCALETVLAGGVFAPASLAGPANQERYEIVRRTEMFTGRKQDVFRLLKEGCSTKTIARRLNIAVGTVKVHLAAIYRTLGVNSRLEAIARAAQQTSLATECTHLIPNPTHSLPYRTLGQSAAFELSRL